jgi:two-component system sensor histidine kinase ChiS
VKSSGLSYRQGFLLALFLALVGLTFAQENFMRFEHISSEQGLSQNVVYCIMQDRKGFMWFGTQNGLNRFDGYEFKKYKYSSRNSSTLPGNTVLVIYEDRAGNLWIGTDGGGLSCFNPITAEFIRYPYTSYLDPNPSTDIDSITTIHEDRNGMLWIGTSGGLLYFDSKNLRWSSFDQKLEILGTLSENRIRAIFEDQRGIIWIGTEGGGLKSFKPETGEFIHFLHQPDAPDSLSGNIVSAIFEDSARNLWVGTQRGLDRFDRRKENFIHYKCNPNNPKGLSGNQVKVIFEDSKKNLWIGTDDGLNLLSLSEKGEVRFIQYRHELNINPYSLSNNNIYSIAEDNCGSLWIGTDGGGINRIDSQKQRFSHFYGKPNDPASLSSNDVSCLLEDKDGILWIGTHNSGLNRYNPETGKFKFYKSSSSDPGSLSSHDVMAIHEDTEGVLWIGTWGGGINRFNRDTETFSRYTVSVGTSKGPNSNDIFCFCEDQDSNLWIGTWKGGLNLFLREKNEFVHYINEAQNPKSISSNGVTFIYPDREDGKFLWVGTYSSGLESFNRHTGDFMHYIHKPANLNSLSNNQVMCVYISPHHQDIVWVGTQGGGLNMLNKETNTWQIFTEEDGLSNNTILGILEDNNRNLWLSTFEGLSRFDLEKGDFRNYYAEDGLQHNEFNQGAFFKGRDGRFYFGGINGFNAFYPEEITQNLYKPPVVITEFKVLNREGFQLEKSILETEEITLSHKDTFSFEFAALNYTASAKNQYAYKLEKEGADDDWIQLHHKRDITFSLVSPGEYVFRVKGSNNDGVWNDVGTSVKLIITPPFWSTWWFRVLLGLAVLGMFFVMYKLRVRRYKIQRKNLEIEVAKRTQEISHQKEIIEEKNTQLEVSNRELKNSEKELRELNATKDKFFSIISHDLRNHLTALLGFSDMLNRSFKKFDDEKKHKYTRSIDQAAKDLYDLLENLLQWARTQTDVLECKPRTFDLGVLIPEVISTYSINAKKKNINLSWQINKNTYAYADKNMVRTVMRNLISNAIKFTDKDGDIQVTANGKDGFVEVSVLDTGVGIRSEKKDTLFRIGKARSTRGTAKEKGTGLGLIICKEFVEKNNGRIWFESPIPDGSKKGSAFRFTLPIPGTGDQ